jgi:hypothetical protein
MGQFRMGQFRMGRTLNTPLAEALSVVLLVAVPAGAVVALWGASLHVVGA